jgi:type I restriction enzyme, S subunit
MTSDFPAGWERRRLADCGAWISGGTPSKSVPEYWGGEIPWVGPKDLHVRYVDDAEEHLTESGVVNGTRVAPEGAILVVVRSMALAKELQISLTRRPVAFNQDIKAIVPSDGVLPRFLFYALWGCHDGLHTLVDEASHGTKRLRTDVLGEYLVALPPRSEQERIASILGALDDKIDSNQRQARLLDEVVQTEFQARFVDLAPKDWPIGRLADLVEIVMGQSPPGTSYTADPADGLHLVQGMGDFGIRYPRVNKFTTEPRKRAQPGAVLMTVRAPVGAVNIARHELCVGRGVCALISDRPAFAEFLVRSLEPLWAGEESGTIFPAVSRKQIAGLQVVLPSKEAIDAFERFAQPLVDKLATLHDETESLRLIRDALLPKLVSGTIRVPDAA